MGFNDLANRMFALYGKQDYQGALDVVEEARDSHGDRDTELTFWEACLVARLGRPEEALSRLAEGVSRGLWWPPGQLADEDLDPVRGLPGWQRVIDQCSAIAAERMKERPDPIIRVGTGHGSLVVIPGAHAVHSEVASVWNSAVPEPWTVVTLPASEPSPSGGWSWPHTIDVSARSVLTEIDQMELTKPIVLAGFSIGSAIACHVVKSAELEVSALIAVAPSSRRGFDEIREIATHVFLLVIGGANDPRIEEYRRLEDDLDPLVGVRVEIVDGLGHANPPDLGRRIESFLRTVNRD